MSTAPRNKVVLAVDDSAEDLALLNAFVMGAGYAFVGASSGEDCLSLIHRCMPRLILLDIQMPGLDGIETCRRLRENVQLKTIPITFLTARHTRADVSECLSAGGNDFIVKPINRAALLQRIDYWASRRVGAAQAA